MGVDVRDLGLGIDLQDVVPDALNYRPPSWPPPKDFPIVIDAQGNAVSRYGDPSWHLWPWALKPLKLVFGDGSHRAGTALISPANANLLRQITAWWLYGPRPVRDPGTLVVRFKAIRGLFVLCSREGISASDLSRFPHVADRLSEVLPKAQAVYALSLLHSLYEQREQLGFVLLDRERLSRLEATLPDHHRCQTAYIPQRIWTYQVNRLRAFLDDFNAHRQGIEDCFRFCIDAYANNAGSLDSACREQLRGSRRPFHGSTLCTGTRTGAVFPGSFSEIARRFGVDDLLRRWLIPPNADLDGRGRGVRSLSSYFSLVNYVGVAYLLNFSMMRIEEGWELRTDCLAVEKDDRFGTFYLLKGPTTKTIKDSDARWVVSPSAQVAVEAMASVARMRISALAANPDVATAAEELSNPYLATRTLEPWGRKQYRNRPIVVRPTPLSFKLVVRLWPKLFDTNELRITEEDLRIARLITPSMGADAFSVGKVWPLAWHQLRRTLAVNMLASGLVSDPALQYQLKHATRECSLYYGQGFSRVRLNDVARNEYIRTMYEVLGRQIAGLFSDRFVSPHGATRKDQILNLVDPKDDKKLRAAAKNGKVSWRQTLLGGCTRVAPCEYGGVDNIVRCGGGDGKAPCADALFDREKAPAIRQLKLSIECRLLDAPDPSPYRESLEAQKRAAENALNVILK